MTVIPESQYRRVVPLLMTFQFFVLICGDVLIGAMSNQEVLLPYNYDPYVLFSTYRVPYIIAFWGYSVIQSLATVIGLLGWRRG